MKIGLDVCEYGFQRPAPTIKLGYLRTGAMAWGKFVKMEIRVAPSGVAS
jgi:hypothetical protein